MFYLSDLEVTECLTHLRTGTNVAGYISWGQHSCLGADYATDANGVHWQGNSGWWIIETVESFNGDQTTYQGNFIKWFSSSAFAGTNYLHTPVGGVSHVDEPGLSGVNDPAAYFGLWQAGLGFGSCAWISRRTEFFQAVGDPLIKR